MLADGAANEPAIVLVGAVQGRHAAGDGVEARCGGGLLMSCVTAVELCVDWP